MLSYVNNLYISIAILRLKYIDYLLFNLGIEKIIQSNSVFPPLYRNCYRLLIATSLHTATYNITSLFI